MCVKLKYYASVPFCCLFVLFLLAEKSLCIHTHIHVLLLLNVLPIPVASLNVIYGQNYHQLLHSCWPTKANRTSLGSSSQAIRANFTPLCYAKTLPCDPGMPSTVESHNHASIQSLCMPARLPCCYSWLLILPIVLSETNYPAFDLRLW